MSVGIISTVQVIHNAPNSVQIHFPADYLGSALLLFATAGCAFLSSLVRYKRPQVFWFGEFCALVALFFTLDAFVYRGTLTLSSASQTATLQERSFYYSRKTIYPLAALGQAIVEPGRYQNKQLALLMTSGEEIDIGNGFSARLGMFQAAQAINGFLSGASSR